MTTYTPYTNAVNNAEIKRNAAAAKQLEAEKLMRSSAELLEQAKVWDKAAEALKGIFDETAS